MATPERAANRRRRRGRVFAADAGPSSPLGPALRASFLPVLAVTALLSATGMTNAVVTLGYLWLFLAAVEPWVWWGWAHLRDRDHAPSLAIYRPGRGAGLTRAHARRAWLRFDGSSIGIRTGTRHEVWLNGPSDPELGVHQLVRLRHQDTTWAFALVDRRGYWRLVLPAEQWAPSGDLHGLAGFAAAAGLTLGDVEAEPFTFVEDVTVPTSAFSTDRSLGPRRVHMMAIWAALALLFTGFFGPAWHTWTLAALTACTAGPAIVMAWRRRRLSRVTQP